MALALLQLPGRGAAAMGAFAVDEHVGSDTLMRGAMLLNLLMWGGYSRWGVGDCCNMLKLSAMEG